MQLSSGISLQAKKLANQNAILMDVHICTPNSGIPRSIDAPTGFNSGLELTRIQSMEIPKGHRLMM
jgi:hypothetical protein